MQKLCFTPSIQTYESITSQSKINTQRFNLKSDVESITNSSIISKQRIDMMFRDTRSVISDYQPPPKPYCEIRKARSLMEADDGYEEKYEIRRKPKNDIQLKIEKMFSEISSSEQETEQLSLPNENKFSIKYIGSVPIVKKITDIEDLQEPLSDLYFKYRQNKPDDNLKDKIEVTTNGLQIEYDNGVGNKSTSKMYPFSCIAVSISVKVFCRKRIGNQTWEYAFLPLAADTENISNNGLLYQKLNGNALIYFKNRNYEDNTSLFVVVLREIDFQTKQLVCQGFICESSDEAIALADIIHKVLKLRHNRILRTRNQRRRFRYKNGMSRLSSIGETVTDSIGETITESLENEKQENHNISDDDSIDNVKKVNIDNNLKKPSTIPRPPKRPPRKLKDKQYAHSIATGSGIDQDEIQVINEENDPGSHLVSMKLNRSGSTRSNKINDNRDVMTRIAIPRSCSFLNADKLNSRYKRRDDYLIQGGIENYDNDIVSGNDENSPLGFVEMFRELQMQEGVNTLDEILNVIVNINGMSFNNLKPIYKEFLLKLALVLTKDELFDRSKFIMEKQKEKSKKRQRLKKFIATKKQIRNLFKNKPKVKLKSRRIFENSGKGKKSKRRRRFVRKTANIAADSTSTDSFFIAKNFGAGNSSRAGNSLKIKLNELNKNCLKNQTTSDDSDYTNRLQRTSIIRDTSSVEGIKPSSSGYFSFSECSYDTESCTCATIERCYCSLKKSKQNFVNNNKNYNANDCYKHDKCYCDKMKNLTLVEQLKLKGFADSESSVSEENSESNRRDSKSSSSRSKGGSKLSKSLEYVENDQFRYRKRMDVYGNEQQIATSVEYESSSTDKSKISGKVSGESSDNLAAVDYNLFARSGNRYQKSRNFYDKSKISENVSSKIVYAQIAHPSSSSKLSAISRKQNNNKYFPTANVRASLPPNCGPVVNHCCCKCSCSVQNLQPIMLPNSSRFPTASLYYRRTNMENDLGYLP